MNHRAWLWVLASATLLSLPVLWLGCLARWIGGADGRLESFSLPATGSLRIRYEPGPMGL